MKELSIVEKTGKQASSVFASKQALEKAPVMLALAEPMASKRPMLCCLWSHHTWWPCSERQEFGLLTLVPHSLIILSCVSFTFNYLSCCCLISKYKTIYFTINGLFHCKYQIFIWHKTISKKYLKQHKATQLRQDLHFLDSFKACFAVWKGSHVLPTQRETEYIYFICLKYFVLFPFLFPIFVFF